MKVLVKILTAAMCFAMASAAFAADSAGKVNAQANLQQLLKEVKTAQTAASAKNHKREVEFRRSRNKQKALLSQAKAEHARVKKESDRLQAIFNKNEKQLNELASQLRNREGNLGEVFGVVRQSAANLKGIIDNSLISAQYPGRGQFLSRMANATVLPSIDDLHKLWYMFLHQAVAEGQIERFPATVTRSDGTQTDTKVVRVGGLVAIHGNEFLNYLPETNQLVVYSTQPSQADAQSRAGELFSAKEGQKENINMAIDPSGGQLLNLLTRSHKTFKQQLDNGGKVGYTIVVLFIIGILIALERIIALTLASNKVKKQLQDPGTPNADNALGRVLAVYKDNAKDDVETLELKLDEAILKEQPALEARLGVIKLISAVAPLLGLLGTVIGMIITFSVITTFGSADPKLMAGGISRALVTTVEGLVTAIPLVMLHAYISSRSGGIIQVLEEQSAGIIAAQAERKS